MRYIANIRCMKLFCSAICASLLLLASPVYGTVVDEPQQNGASGYDVVYVIDNSRSVWKQADARNEAFINITGMAEGKDVNVGAVYFADMIYKTMPLTSVEKEEDAQQVKNFLDMTERDNNNISTNIGNALESAISLLEENETDNQQMIILFSDGINENVTEDPEYKKAADELTAEQVAILKEKDIPIYCVYLQKDRNDEAYLQELVNYFSDEEDFASDRFFHVTSDQIDTLSDTFSDVFQIMETEVIIAQEAEEELQEEQQANTETETAESETVIVETEEETVPETETEEPKSDANEQTAAPSVNKEEKAFNPLFLIPLGVVLLAAIFLIIKKSVSSGKKKELLKELAKAQGDYRFAKERSGWAYSDFEREYSRHKDLLAVFKSTDRSTPQGTNSQAIAVSILKSNETPEQLLIASAEHLKEAADLLAKRKQLLEKASEMYHFDSDGKIIVEAKTEEDIKQNIENITKLAEDLNAVNTALETLISELKKVHFNLDKKFR